MASIMRTPRLLLRTWRNSDRAPFARLNADPNVMRFFPSTLTSKESDEMFERIQAHLEQHCFGLYAVELLRDSSFIGFVGLAVPTFTTRFTPCVEIGWRLAAEHWGQGLATEGALAVARFAFESAGLSELVSFTIPANLPSRRVMEKIGMTHDPADDFDHPRIAASHPYCRHVLYRLRRPEL